MPDLCRIVSVARRRAAGEHGFTLIESVMTLGLFFLATLALVMSLNTGVRGVITGRQRTTANSVAKDVLEEIRAAGYGRIGHRLHPPADRDATLDDDTGNGAALDYDAVTHSYTYEATGEPLADGGNNPAVPQHHWSGTLDGTPYEVWAYVTAVSPATGEPHKRVTVEVEFGRVQYDAAAVENRVRLSSLVFADGGGAGSLGDGLTEATVEADAGVLRITGDLDGVALESIHLWYPHVRGDLSTHLVDEVSGWARSSRLRVHDTSGLLETESTGCTQSGDVIDCPVAEVSTAADDDPWTTGVDDYDTDSASESARRVDAGGVYTLDLGGSGTVESTSTVCAGLACGPLFGSPAESDGHPDQVHRGVGPSDVAFDLRLGDDDDCDDDGCVKGSLAESDGSIEARARIDQDSVSSSRLTRPSGRLEYPEIRLITLQDPTPLELVDTSVITVSAFSVDAEAPVGPTAGVPRIDGSLVEVEVVETTALDDGAVRSFTFTPGEDTLDESAAAEFTLDVAGGLTTVSVEVSVVARAGTTAFSEDPPGTTTDARAELGDGWFVITADVEIVRGAIAIADLHLELDYGQLLTCGAYGEAGTCA